MLTGGGLRSPHYNRWEGEFHGFLFLCSLSYNRYGELQTTLMKTLFSFQFFYSTFMKTFQAYSLPFLYKDIARILLEKFKIFKIPCAPLASAATAM